MNGQKILLLSVLATTSTLFCSSGPSAIRLDTITQEMNTYFATLHIPEVRTKHALIDFFNETVNNDLRNPDKCPYISSLMNDKTKKEGLIPLGIMLAMAKIHENFAEKKIAQLFPDAIKQ